MSKTSAPWRTSFFKTCTALQVDLASMTEVQLADILITMSLSRSTSHGSSSCSSVIKALRWLVKSAEVGCLQVVHSVLIGTFLNQKIPRDRKQAPPLPLWALVQWERRILMSNCTVLEVILLGTFLVMAWGSLRFSDAQRMDLHKIIYHAETMRGVIWRSKTAVSGMPLAVAAEGFLSRGPHNWLWKFLTVLDSVLDTSGLSEVDFLLPLVDDNGPVYPLQPMDFATALFYLRKFLGCPWRQRPDPLQHLKLNFIQQMKRECVLRSEARHGQAGGLKLCLRFCVLSLFAFRLRFLDMKVLEELPSSVTGRR